MENGITFIKNVLNIQTIMRRKIFLEKFLASEKFKFIFLLYKCDIQFNLTFYIRQYISSAIHQSASYKRILLIISCPCL